jgi:uncharacterized protein
VISLRVLRTLLVVIPLTIFGLGGCAVVVGGQSKVAVNAETPVKVIYHVSEGNEQATNALRNIRNHLAADPSVKISVVTHANGIDFLLDGAKDKNGNDYLSNVQELVKRGVDFRVCKITLERRMIDAKRVIEEAKLVPSGVAEVARLQAKEGYVYLKP